jgi:hypothetical protein
VRLVWVGGGEVRGHGFFILESPFKPWDKWGDDSEKKIYHL